MGLKIAGHLFYGPFPVEKVAIKKNHTPALFAIVCRTGESWNPTFRLIDIGFSGADGITLAQHPPRAAWVAENDGLLQVYLLEIEAHEGDVGSRAAAIIELCRNRYQPPRGIISLAE